MESGLELESSLVFPPMMVKNGMESSMEMESSPGFPPMRSSPVLSKGTVMSPSMMSPVNRSWGQTSWRRWSPVLVGLPFKVEFSNSMESSFEAWKQSGIKTQLSMESSPLMYVKGVKGLDVTRSLKMYRNKSRKSLIKMG